MTSKEAGELGDLGKIIHVSSTHWFEDWNLGRPTKEYGDVTEKGDLFKSLRDNGWRRNGDGLIEVERFSAIIDGEDWHKRAVAERTAKWEELRALAKADRTKAADLAVFEDIYTEKTKGDKNVLRPIVFIGDTGNRRSKVYFPAMVARQKLDPPLPITVEIPVLIKTFEGKESAVDRLEVQILENDQKNVGFQETGPLDKLYQAKFGYDRGKSQTWMRKLWGATTGQKFFAIVEANNKFPGLKIYDRMFLDPTDPAYLNCRGLKGAELTTRLQRLPGPNLTAYNAKRKDKGLELAKPLTEDEVAEFMSEIGTGSNAQKILPRKTMEELSTNCPVLPIRSVFKGIMLANTDAYEYLMKGEVGLNAIDSLLRSGDYPMVEMILNEIAVSPNGKFRSGYLEKLVKMTVLLKKVEMTPNVKERDKLVEQIGELVK